MKMLSLILVLNLTCIHTAIYAEQFPITVQNESFSDSYAALAHESAQKSLGVISGKLGHSPSVSITIILAASDKRFREISGGRLPEWSAAAMLDDSTIVISPLRGHKHRLERIIAHELAHIVINDAAGNSFIPRWFHEGVAETLSGGWGIGNDLYLAWKVFRNREMTFADIQNVFDAEQLDAGLAYKQSRLAIIFLEKIRGGSALESIIGNLAEGDDFSTAFSKTAGISLETFEQEYIAWLREKYGMEILVVALPWTWLLIMGISLGVFLVKRKRNKRLLEIWGVDEKEGHFDEL